MNEMKEEKEKPVAKLILSEYYRKNGEKDIEK